MTGAVTVVVVNFNSGALTRRCLETAALDLDGRPWDAIVVDNGSGAADLAPLHDLPRTRIVRNETNRGFGAAVNQAVRCTTSPWLWLLNPDCRVEPGAIDALADALGAFAECAVAAPCLLNEDGSVQASARGEPSALTGLFGRHALLARWFPDAAATRRNLRARDLVAAGAENAEVDWVMGAAMLIRRSAFEAVGGFDERFFLYWEDADLCRRLRDRGFTIRYVPRARVVHTGGASTATDHALATRAFHRSAYRYYATHVARTPWHPGRWFARGALGVRGWWRARRRR